MEWRFDYSFRITMAQESGLLCVRFSGDLDALTAKMLQRDDPIPGSTETVVLDLSDLENIDITGVREIRRIEAAIAASGGSPEIRGASDHVQAILDVIPAARPVAATTPDTIGELRHP